MPRSLTSRTARARALARKAHRNRARLRVAAARRLATRAGTTGRRGLLSIVIPTYNVEEYLAECLDSVLAQTYWKLEAIVVIDGGSDSSADIADRYAAKDKRVRVHRQENAGLSGARNTGARLARGEYLWFVDSDDIITRDAARTMIASLQRSGSDFAVGSYVRFDSRKTYQPGSWIRGAHATLQQRATLATNPEILVNAVAWSKMYRRSFWNQHQFSFIDRMLYEDQPVSARAYALADAFDVVPDVIYRWRMRDDGSSISQQAHQIKDLRARFHSYDLALGELADHPAAATERLVQIVANDLQVSTVHLPETDQDFWQAMADGITPLIDALPADRWYDVPPAHAGILWLLYRRDFERARQYVQRDGLEANLHTSASKDGAVVARIPFWDDPTVGYPLLALRFAPRQMRVVSQLHRARWTAPGVLHLEGWAYIPSIAAQQMTGGLTARLVSTDAEPHVIPVRTTGYVEPDVDRLSNQAAIDHTDFGWRTELVVDDLGLRAGAEYELEFELTADGVTCIERLWRATPGSSATDIPPCTTPGGMTASVRRDYRQPWRLRAEPAVTIDAARSVGRDVHLTLNVARGGRLRYVELTPRSAGGGLLVDYRRRLRVRPAGAGRGTVRIEGALLDVYDAVHWELTAASNVGSGVQMVPVTWPEAPAAPLRVPGGLTLAATPGGRARAWKTSSAVIVRGATARGEAIELDCDVIGAPPTAATVSDHRYEIPCPVRDLGDGRYRITVPTEMERWGAVGPIPSGRYALAITSGNRATTLNLADTGVADMPVDTSAGAQARLQLAGRRLRLVIEPRLALDERGARNQQRLKLWHRNGEHALDETAVLMRTYYGESATGNALGVHHELRRRRAADPGGPAAKLRLYWAVKDSSVPVPEGGIPVVIGSTEWYRLLSEAKYLIDNVHQVPYFTKRPGQIFVETLHGYPFKKAGLAYWRSAGYSQARIDSFLERHQQWDYLLSPAPYATELLERDFPSPAETLEIGYPRNDLFFDPERLAARRAETRRALGLADDATVVLYAPTYRDNLSRNEFQSVMIDSLKLPELLAAVSEKVVILLRGHMMNARDTTRTALGGYRGRVIDVTDHPEISDLCAASDAAILDYSSLRFDYALTGKPMVFHVPDLELYRDEARGWMLPYEDTAPGPLVRTTAEVARELGLLGQWENTYGAARRTFLDTYLPLEDGQAAARLVDAVFADAAVGAAGGVADGAPGGVADGAAGGVDAGPAGKNEER